MERTYVGIGFWQLLTLVLIVLKLTGYIAISWWWLVFIYLVPLIFVAGIFVVIGLVCLLAYVLTPKRARIL